MFRLAFKLWSSIRNALRLVIHSRLFITKFENFELKSYVSFWKLRNKHFLTEILINFDRVLMIYSMKIVLIFFASYFCIK